MDLHVPAGGAKFMLFRREIYDTKLVGLTAIAKLVDTNDTAASRTGVYNVNCQLISHKQT